MKKLMYLLSVVLIMSMLGCGSAPTNTEPKQQEKVEVDKQQEAPKNTNFAVGDTFKLGDLQYKINGVRYSGGSDMVKPKDGNAFLLIDITIENQGKEDATVSSMMSFKLVDKDGRSQDYSLSATMLSNGQLDGTIAAGRKISGELGYELPKAEQTYELEIKPSPGRKEIGIVEIPMK